MVSQCFFSREEEKELQRKDADEANDGPKSVVRPQHKKKLEKWAYDMV